MTMTLLNSITVFVLAVFIGIEIISKVPTMSRTAATRYVKLIAVCDSARMGVIRSRAWTACA